MTSPRTWTMQRRKTSVAQTPSMPEYHTETKFKIHKSNTTLVRTYRRHLPTLQEHQAASLLTSWQSRTKQYVTEPKPKPEWRSVTSNFRSKSPIVPSLTCHYSEPVNHQLIASGEGRWKGFFSHRMFQTSTSQWTSSPGRLNHLLIIANNVLLTSEWSLYYYCLMWNYLTDITPSHPKTCNLKRNVDFLNIVKASSCVKLLC